MYDQHEIGLIDYRLERKKRRKIKRAVYEAGHIVNVCSLAEALPHVHRISAAILTYDCVLDNASLKPEQFGVKNRNMIRAYANTEPKKAESGRDGRYVILELEPSQISPWCRRALSKVRCPIT